MCKLAVSRSYCSFQAFVFFTPKSSPPTAQGAGLEVPDHAVLVGLFVLHPVAGAAGPAVVQVEAMATHVQAAPAVVGRRIAAWEIAATS